ncbi:MAG TPA: glycosyltransferase, partial [Tepidisphaeraceae bacterium]|nr:glycosyltransferase [Tepidisphaeraceae bacterium]
MIQTHNEELNLPHTLESVKGWVRHVFVVDSGSTDNTRKIAEEFGATFIHHPWEGYAAQKNWALDNLPFEAPWVLILDADEAVSPKLREEIIADVKSLSLNNNRIESLVEQLYAINKRLVGLEGRLMRLADSYGV